MSDLLIVLAATALLKPCFFKNKFRTAFASSFSAATRVAGTTLTLELKDPSNFARQKKSFLGIES